MSHPEAPAAAPVVEPIVKDVLVRCDPARAFDTFTNSIGRWWPMEGHSVGGASARVEFRSG